MEQAFGVVDKQLVPLADHPMSGDERHRFGSIFSTDLRKPLDVYVVQMIGRSLRSVEAALHAMADDDLTVPTQAEARSRDELGRIAGALDRTREAIRGTLQAISASSRALCGASTRLGP